MDDLSDLVADWPVDRVAVGVTDRRSTLGIAGDTNWVTRIASVSKLLVGFSALVAIEEESIGLDDPAGPPGSTVEHLMAHASGLGFDTDDVLAQPGRRRIYSNTGIEALARHLESRTGMEVETYLRSGLLDPLGLTATDLRGSPAHGIWSNVEDLLVFAREVMAPTLLSPQTLAAATRPHFDDLSGVLPGVGSFDPNPWGLTFEIKGAKDPHWTGRHNSPATFGHFGGSGTFLWVDPEAGLAAVAITSREFDSWALDLWPDFSDAVLERYRG